MKINKKLQYFLCISLLVATAYLVFFQYKRYLAPLWESVRSEEVPKIDYSKIHNFLEFRAKLSGLAINEKLNSEEYTGGNWQKSIRAHSREIVNNRSYDFIVLPIQDVNAPSDKISRTLAAKYIAQKIAQRENAKVMEPELASKILGERACFYNNDEVFGLAKETGANVIHLYLSKNLKTKDDKNQPQGELAVILTDTNKIVKKYYFLPITWISGKGVARDEFAPGNFLEDQVSRAADTIVTHLFRGRKVVKQTAKKESQYTWSLKTDVEALFPKLTSPIDHAAYFQLLALLTPRLFSDDREQLFERSLAILEQADPTDQYVENLKARALFHLHRRPEALLHLKQVKNPENIALKEFLDGNYYKLQQELSQIHQPLLYTLSFLEFAQLSIDYNKPVPKINAEMVDPNWYALIKLVINENNYWYFPNMRNLATAMTTLFPEYSQFLENEQKSSNLLNDSGDDEQQVQFLSDLIGYTTKQFIASSHPYGDRLESADLWNLYRNILIDISYKEMRHTIYTLGAYKSGVAYGEKLNALLDGLPAFSSTYAVGLYYMSRNSTAETSKYYLKKALDADCSVSKSLYSYEYARFNFYIGIYAMPGKFKCNIPAYLSNNEFPSDLVAYSKNNPSQRYLALPYTNHDFKCVDKKSMSQAEYETILSSRFEGSPDKIRQQTKDLEKAGKPEKAIALLQDAIAKGEHAWWIYEKLGDIFLKQSKYLQASESYYSYPDFFNTTNDMRVGVANYAYMAGAKFFNRGRYKESKSFFTLSSSFGTGASREINANYLLAILNKNYKKASEFVYSDWKRYNRLDSLSKYLTLREMLDGSTDVQSILEDSFPKFDQKDATQNIWLPLFVADRLHSTKPPSIKVHLNKIIGESPTIFFAKCGDFYLFTQGLVDRRLTSSYIEEAQLYPYNHGKRQTTPSTLKKIFFQSPNCSPTENLCTEYAGEVAHKLDRSNFYANLYMAYYYLQHAEYQNSANLLSLIDQERPFTENKRLKNFTGSKTDSYLLPFVTRILIERKATTSKMVEQFIKELNSSPQANMNMTKMALALLYASQKDVVKAREKLQAVKFEDLESNEYVTTFKWYEIVLGSEWLYKYTGDDNFINLGMKWAKTISFAHPELSWPYAFMALYGKDKKERVRASGWANYLDKNSYWLSQVPEKIRRQGTQWWKKKSPLFKAKERAPIFKRNI